MRQLFLVLLLFAATIAVAQQRRVALPDSMCHSLRVRSFIPPIIGLAAGSAITFMPALSNVNPTVQNAAQGWREQSGIANTFKNVDDVLQLTPVVCLPLLRACGVPGRHDYWGIFCRTMMTYSLVFVTTAVTKTWTEVPRPYNGYIHNSFFSGHTCTAFAGAEMLRLEYKDSSPWIGIAAYIACSFTGALRIYHNRHWLGDVLAGAGAGILCAQTSYWLCDKAQNWEARRDEVPLTMTSRSAPRYELIALDNTNITTTGHDSSSTLCPPAR